MSAFFAIGSLSHILRYTDGETTTDQRDSANRAIYGKSYNYLGTAVGAVS